MATTGKLIGSASSSGWYAILEYSIVQDDINLTSTITETLKVYNATGNSYNLSSNEAYYTFQGGGKRYQPYEFPSIGTYTIGTNTFTVKHNDAGDASVVLSALWCSENETAYTPYSVSVSGSITLPTITTGFVNIDNGTNMERYIPYIDNGTSWDRVIPYIDNGSSWDKVG